MQVWKLIAHGTDLDAVEAMTFIREFGRIAIGWGDTGDLNAINPESVQQLVSLIQLKYPEASNAHTGGPSLWNLWNGIEDGDLIIVVGGKKRQFVAEVIGEYRWCSPSESPADYYHQIPIAETAINPDQLWKQVGAKVLDGQNPHLTLARCPAVERGAGPVPKYREGVKFEIRATARERSRKAREDCLARSGYQCTVCGFDFENTYGLIGRGFIHVHHLNPLSATMNDTLTDPSADLVPLCPNCHAMVHRANPPISPDQLRSMMKGA